MFYTKILLNKMNNITHKFIYKLIIIINILQFQYEITNKLI